MKVVRGFVDRDNFIHSPVNDINDYGAPFRRLIVDSDLTQKSLEARAKGVNGLVATNLTVLYLTLLHHKQEVITPVL